MRQNKRQIEALLITDNLRPLKRFGQNFLIDGNLVNKLLEAAAVVRDDVVLEVGPGTGSLTDQLLEKAGHVIAVEIDKGLHGVCRERFKTSDRLTLLHRDVLEKKSQISPEVLDRLREAGARLGGRILLVANLPYQIATPLIVELLMGHLEISRMCFTVQAEVGERIMSKPGTKAYGPISIFFGARARVHRIVRVPPEAFWPSPKVDSIMLCVDVIQNDRLINSVQETLVLLVHVCFNQRRKTMKSNLRRLVAARIIDVVETDGRWNLADRPERVTVEQWIDLAEFLAQHHREDLIDGFAKYKMTRDQD